MSVSTFGYFSRLSYDKDVYDDKLFESTYPLGYMINSDSIFNRDGCFLGNGSNTKFMGYGVSAPIKNTVAQGQKLVDLDSILSNRNLKRSKLKRGRVNPVNLKEINMIDADFCPKKMESNYSRLDLPPMMFKDVGSDRWFYDLPKNPQEHIFYDWAIETRNTTKDSFVPHKHESVDGKRIAF